MWSRGTREGTLGGSGNAHNWNNVLHELQTILQSFNAILVIIVAQNVSKSLVQITLNRLVLIVWWSIFVSSAPFFWAYLVFPYILNTRNGIMIWTFWNSLTSYQQMKQLVFLQEGVVPFGSENCVAVRLQDYLVHRVLRLCYYFVL